MRDLGYSCGLFQERWIFVRFDRAEARSLIARKMMDQASLKIGMRPTDPGVFVREEIFEPLNLSIARAAEALGVRRATLSELANGKSALSPEMALRIEKAFGFSMDTLPPMQAMADAHEMRQRADSIEVKKFVA
jgi:addiction module HigA family antidote